MFQLSRRDNYECYFVVKDRIFACEIDYVSNLFTLDEITDVEGDDYDTSFEEDTIHIIESMLGTYLGDTEEEQAFSKKLNNRSHIKLSKDILKIKYGNDVEIAKFDTYEQALEKVLEYKSQIEKMEESKAVSLEGVILDDETRKMILSTINFVKNKEKYEEMGCVIPKGILLVGSAGTGKTLLAEVISKESGRKFKFTCGSELLGSYVGSSAKAIRELFDEMKNENSIVYIDEIDAIGSKRSDSESSKEYRSALNQLLSCMSNPVYNKVMVIASTNVLDQLDPALTRAGRFDRILEIKVPSREMRIDLFKLYIGRLKHNEDEIDYELLADRTEGEVGASISAICNFAGIRAVDDGCEITKMEHILEELEAMYNNSSRGKLEKEKARKKIGFC
jgi:ATP-dependent 26S proteasome regulatory subunit